MTTALTPSLDSVIAALYKTAHSIVPGAPIDGRRRAQQEEACSGPLARASVTDVLEAYLVVEPTLPTDIKPLRTPVTAASQDFSRVLELTLSSASFEPTSIDEMVAVLLSHPDRALDLASVVLRNVTKYEHAARLPSLGLLTKKIHEAAAFTPNITRGRYLLRQARRHRPKLSTHQFELTCTLSQEWEGPFSSLIETVHAMEIA